MSTALIPFTEVQGMADAIARSGLFGMKTPEQALALMLVAQAEGQHPATITQEYDIIQGKAARKTHSVLARFQAAGGTVEWHELSEVIADATFSHKAGGKLRMSWTFDQAKKAGLTNKDNWKNYPRAMLRARCIAEGVRAVYPAALGGMLVAEEAMDLPPDHPMKTVDPATGEITPQKPPAPQPPVTWPAEKFAEQLPRWTKAVQAGLKSNADILALARSKGALTAEQEKAIKDIKAAPADDVTDVQPKGEPQAATAGGDDDDGLPWKD
jgi:hypothetical protein